MVREFISQLPPDKLVPFEKHPYQVREDATPSLSQALRMKQLSREAKLTPFLPRKSPIRKSRFASKPSRCGSISRAITLRSRWSGRS